MRIPRAEISCLLPVESGWVILPAHQCAEILLETFYVGMIDEMTGHLTELSLHSLPFPKCQPSVHLVGLSVDQL